jgi:hypothetical protein
MAKVMTAAERLASTVVRGTSRKAARATVEGALGDSVKTTSGLGLLADQAAQKRVGGLTREQRRAVVLERFPELVLLSHMVAADRYEEILDAF